MSNHHLTKLSSNSALFHSETHLQILLLHAVVTVDVTADFMLSGFTSFHLCDQPIFVSTIVLFEVSQASMEIYYDMCERATVISQDHESRGFFELAAAFAPC